MHSGKKRSCASLRNHALFQRSLLSGSTTLFPTALLAKLSHGWTPALTKTWSPASAGTTFGEPTRSKESRAIKAATLAVVRKMEVHSPWAPHTQLGSRVRTRLFEQGASHSRVSSPMACDDLTGLEGAAAAAADSAMLEEDATPIRMQIRTRAFREAARVARLSAALHHQVCI